MKIFFIRHCKTESNLSNVWQGKIDNPLSSIGYEELNNLKKTISFKPDLIFSSPMKRAITTAEGIKAKDTKIVVDNSLLERDFGSLDGSLVVESDKIKMSDYDLNSDLDLNVEKIQDMYHLRIKPFLMNLKNDVQNENKNIVIVSHSWVGRLIAFFASGEKDKNIIKKTPQNAVIYEFDI